MKPTTPKIVLALLYFFAFYWQFVTYGLIEMVLSPLSILSNNLIIGIWILAGLHVLCALWVLVTLRNFDNRTTPQAKATWVLIGLGIIHVLLISASYLFAPR